jgi:hypothetical protein
LDRVEKEGDARVLKELERFRGTKPCGIFGMRKCPRCPKQKDAIERAAFAVRGRGSQ